MTTLSRAPIYVQLDRKRELRFNLNTAILLRDVGFDAKPYTVKTGERVRADGVKEAIYDVDPASLRAHLWAGLQYDARKHNEDLTVEQAGELLEEKSDIVPVMGQIHKALLRFFGQEVSAPGEAKAPRRGRKSSR